LQASFFSYARISFKSRKDNMKFRCSEAYPAHTGNPIL
jgi:hypothetical protein